MEHTDWKTVERDFCGGMSLVAICAKHRIVMLDLLAAIKAGGWKRGHAGGGGDQPPTPPGGDDPSAAREPAPVLRLPMLIDRAAQTIVDDVARETIERVVESHRKISLRARRRLEREQEEFDAMVALFATFTDQEHIAKLTEKDDGGEALRAYLRQALIAFRQRTDAHVRLAQGERIVVELERAVWNLDADTGEQVLTYDDLLEQLQQPLAPRELPPNIVDFEKAALRRLPKNRGAT